jgi:hypothetical protein
MPPVHADNTNASAPTSFHIDIFESEFPRIEHQGDDRMIGQPIDEPCCQGTQVSAVDQEFCATTEPQWLGRANAYTRFAPAIAAILQL